MMALFPIIFYWSQPTFTKKLKYDDQNVSNDENRHDSQLGRM
jgi:hypothetical protein